MQYFNKSKYEFNRTTLTKLKTGSATAYGMDLIDTNSDKIYKYEFKILEKNGPIIIGIDEGDGKWIDKVFYVQKDTLNYSYTHEGDLHIQGEYTSDYGDKYGKMDTITMIINCKSMTICWCNNNKKYKEIPIKATNNKYRAAIFLFSKQAALQLLNVAISAKADEADDEVDAQQPQQNKPKKNGDNAKKIAADDAKISDENGADCPSYSELKVQVEKLKKDNGKLLEEHKAMEVKINNLEKENRELKLQLIDPSQYMQWKWPDILQWILSLENGRFVKYCQSLEQCLKEEGVTGPDLNQVDILIVKGWGVVNFKDKQSLFDHIQGLSKQGQNGYAASTANEGANDAPTAYI